MNDETLLKALQGAVKRNQVTFDMIQSSPDKGGSYIQGYLKGTPVGDAVRIPDGVTAVQTVGKWGV